MANLVLYLAGFDVRGEDPTAGGAFVVCAVFAVAAAGMWRVKYWAVIGFEVLLGVLLVSACAVADARVESERRRCCRSR